MNKRILYTRYDGGVSVCQPTTDIFRIMQGGGYWNDRPHGFIDKQIERNIEAGHLPQAAVDFCRAVAFGGCSEKDVWRIIRDRDCGHLGTMHELIDVDELPDRWFRDAWTRSPNGGPVGVHLGKARKIQWKRIAETRDHENKRRYMDMEAPIEFSDQEIQRAIFNARDDEELRRVWPEELRV